LPYKRCQETPLRQPHRPYKEEEEEEEEEERRKEGRIEEIDYLKFVVFYGVFSGRFSRISTFLPPKKTHPKT